LRYGVLGDIHSNVEALTAVLDALDLERPQGLLSPGDIVGYGGAPRECLRLVRERAPATVAGNHDWAVAGRLPLDYFNSYARDAILWTRKTLDRDDVKFLGALPLTAKEGPCTLAHGTIHDPELFDYLQTPYDAHLSFSRLPTPYGIVGHSHIPVTFLSGTTITYVLGPEVDLSSAAQALVNVGSVGQPRDEDPRAAYGILDTETKTLTLRRVAYDVEAAIARIRAANLPEVLGERLRIGR
jgi:diadenosine tetraphosphatase ApaH/serine/threonine PP2A family protein phosphatase